MSNTQSAGFFAYPSQPSQLAETVSRATESARGTTRRLSRLKTWQETDIAGQFIHTAIFSEIDAADYLCADITYPNFNVIYEIGYAIGRRTPILLTRNTALTPDHRVTALGFFDTIGHRKYENAAELREILVNWTLPPPFDTQRNPNQAAPVYHVQPPHRTDAALRIHSSLSRHRLTSRTFDPNEYSRLSTFEVLKEVGSSHGVLLFLLPSNVDQHETHNYRCAYVAGVATGLGVPLTILQQGEDPVPLDYRELVKPFTEYSQIDKLISDFHIKVSTSYQAISPLDIPEPRTFLGQIDIGASSAENEHSTLPEYYLGQQQLASALDGEIRLAVGRKGSGKSALFFQLQYRLSQHGQHVVLDLKPDGFKLRKFKERVSSLVTHGTFEHTVTIFWQYVLGLEVCREILTQDSDTHIHDHRLYEPYNNLKDAFHEHGVTSEGNFSERLSHLIDRISEAYEYEIGDARNVRLDEPEISRLIYGHDVRNLLAVLRNYLRHKDALWLLFDNIDKGWPAQGIEPADITIIQTLLDATRNLEKELHRHDIECHTVVFLRSDVHDELIRESSDRGKDRRADIDWRDWDLLKELIRRRLCRGAIPHDTDFEDIWRQVIHPNIANQDSWSYLANRCIMRPRYLIDIFNYCKSFAVNLGHEKISEADVKKGIEQYSSDIVEEINHEIRDVFPNADEILYAFIESPSEFGNDVLRLTLSSYDIAAEEIDDLIWILLWYGVLGVRRGQEPTRYIYDFDYRMKRLEAILRNATHPVYFVINPAFRPGLEITEDE